MKRFVGWLRTLPGGRWHPVCTAPSWGACWQMLLGIPSGVLACEKMVVPEGRKPW